jgi:hypothetical protein
MGYCLFRSDHVSALTTSTALCVCFFVEAMDQEDYGVGYIEEDHPLRPQAAAQSLALLQVPDKSGRHSRNTSISSSVTDLDAPIYTREDARSTYRHVSTGTRVSLCLQPSFLLTGLSMRENKMFSSHCVRADWVCAGFYSVSSPL